MQEYMLHCEKQEKGITVWLEYMRERTVIDDKKQGFQVSDIQITHIFYFLLPSILQNYGSFRGV